MNQWDHEKRARIKRKMERQADNVAARIGAKAVVMIAFFEDGEHLHMLDCGKSPMAFGQLYKQLASAHEIMVQSGGEDVVLS